MPFSKDDRNIGLIQNVQTLKTSYAPYHEDTGGPQGGPCGRNMFLYHLSREEFGNAWTISTWVSTTQWSIYNDLIACKNTSGSSECQFYFSIINAETLNLGINGPSGTVSAPYNYDVNTWYHVAATYDGKRYALYTNGVLLKQGEYSSPIKTGAMNIGVNCRAGDNAGTNFIGNNKKLYDFRIYSHALHDWEIKKIYNSMAFEIEGGLYLEGTENINAVADRTITETAYNGSINQYGYNDTSNLKKEVYYENGVPIAKVTIRSGSTKAYPYVFFSPIHPLSGQFKTLSFDYFPSIQPHIIPYTYRGSANVSWVSNYDTTGYTTSSVATLPVNVGKWNHIDMTLEGTSSSTDGWGYIRLGSGAHDANTSNYWLFKNVQVTNKDHPTKYSWSNREEWVTESTAQATDIIPYNIVQSGSSLYFNGMDSAIKVPITKIITGGTWSINLWFYRPNGQFGSKAWETLIGGQSGFEFSSKRSSSSSPMLVAYSWGQSSSGGKDYEYDKWNMVTMVRTPSQFKAYLNGENFLTTTSTGAVPNGDYFIGAWQVYNKQNFKGYMRRFSIYAKAMSDDDVMNLYIHNE